MISVIKKGNDIMIKITQKEFNDIKKDYVRSGLKEMFDDMDLSREGKQLFKQFAQSITFEDFECYIQCRNLKDTTPKYIEICDKYEVYTEGYDICIIDYFYDFVEWEIMEREKN